ncbi:MAG: DUF429 domain-containing protein [Acidimicrobiia bacterium]|nr:DUF429 domain-containing protein [Acidimicrobiia bacterium]
MGGEAAALGIDLAWSDRNPSGVCALSRDGQVLGEGILRTDDELLQWVRDHAARSAAIAIDAPLLVPNETGKRPCETAVAQAYGSRHAGPHPSNRTLMTRVTGRIRGEELVRVLESHGFADPWSESDRTVLEVFPHPSLIEMFDLDERLAYKKGSVADRRAGLRDLDRLLGTLGDADPPAHFTPVNISDDVRGKALKNTEDLLDARVCAWVALRWHRHGPDGMRIFGDAGTGHIAIPQ